MTVANIYSEIIDYMAKTPRTNHDASRSAMPTGDTTTTPTRKQSFDPCAGAVKRRVEQQERMEQAHRPISRPITFVSLVRIFRVSYRCIYPLGGTSTVGRHHHLGKIRN